MPRTTTVPVPLAIVLRIAIEYEQAGRVDDGAELLGSILDAIPNQCDALHLLGVMAFRNNNLDSAIRLMELAIHQGEASSLLWRNICSLYERTARYEDAVLAGKRAIDLDPGDPHAHHNLGVAYYRLLQIDEAVACAQRAIAIAPSLATAHFALAEALLVQGEFTLGWQEYEWRFQIPGVSNPMPDFSTPQWDGTPIFESGLLLIADQGFGDVIQFMRYIPWVRERCLELTLACGVELQSLFRYNFPWLQLTNRLQPSAAFAVYCPLSGLPRLHDTTLNTMPITDPYVRAPPGHVARWKQRLDALSPTQKRRVGIVWAGRGNPPNRSMKLAMLAPLAALDDIVLVALQMGANQSEIAIYRDRAPLINLGAEIEDFSDTAAIIANLDLVVTIDTAVGHLAAAMGRPAWIMLPYSADWRWLLERLDSPWYPTARLFRQHSPAGWEEVTACVAEALSDFTSLNTEPLSGQAAEIRGGFVASS